LRISAPYKFRFEKKEIRSREFGAVISDAELTD